MIPPGYPKRRGGRGKRFAVRLTVTALLIAAPIIAAAIAYSLARH